jgi:hypothetical protein
LSLKINSLPQDIKRVASPDYKPSQYDIIQSTHFSSYETRITLDQLSLHLIDGGLPTELTIKSDFFININSLLFAVNLANYNSTYWSMKSFSDIMDSPHHQDTPIILLLNAQDLIVDHHTLNYLFPDFSTRNFDTVDQLQDFFHERFKTLTPPGQRLYWHIVHGLDVPVTQLVLDTIKQAASDKAHGDLSRTRRPEGTTKTGTRIDALSNYAKLLAG